jgi:hypothetical protein
LGGKGIYLTNPTNMDGFFTSVIKDNFIANGIYLERCGDSVQIIRNKSYGENYGLYVTMVSGANSILIEANNLTNKLGCLYFSGESDPRIVFNNFEALVENTSSDNALVVITATAPSKARTVTIKYNTFSMLSDYVDTGVLVDYAVATDISNNYFGRGTPATQKAFILTANSSYTFVGKNIITAAETDEGYTNNGVGTRGVFSSFTFAAGYGNHAGHDACTLYIGETGNIQLNGSFDNVPGGTWADSNIISTLPIGARPKATQYFLVTGFITSVGYSTANISVESNGDVRIYDVNGKAFAWLSLSGVSFQSYY